MTNFSNSLLSIMKTEAQPRPFSRMPVELLERTFEFCPRDTLRSLCQVSKRFQTSSVRFLYRDISLSSLSSIIRCTKSLASNPSTASAVKALKISYSTPSRRLLHSFYRILGEAFRNLIHLLDLKLLLQDSNIVHILTSCTFPCLRRFECSIPHFTLLALFLSRHLELNYLQLSPKSYLYPQHFRDFPSTIHLPKLEYLVAFSPYIPSLAHGVALRAVFIQWIPMEPAVEECIAVLRHSSSDSLRTLICCRVGWNLDLIDAISSALPDILVLSITNIILVNNPPYYSTLDLVGTYLSRFTSLRRLDFQSIGFQSFKHSHLMDRDFICVRAWGTACPTLVECTLPDGLKWIRVREHIWFPDPSQSKGADWLEEMVICCCFPEMEQLIDIAEQLLRERATGPGGVDDIGVASASNEPTALALHESIECLAALRQSIRDET